MTPFSEEVIKIISLLPKGKVASYGQIATAAGNPKASRQVSRLLHTCTKKYNLPWHRVINSSGKISLKGESYYKQVALLESEDVEFNLNGSIDFKRFGFFRIK